MIIDKLLKYPLYSSELNKWILLTDIIKNYTNTSNEYWSLYLSQDHNDIFIVIEHHYNDLHNSYRSIISKQTNKKEYLLHSYMGEKYRDDLDIYDYLESYIKTLKSHYIPLDDYIKAIKRKININKL